MLTLSTHIDDNLTWECQLQVELRRCASYTWPNYVVLGWALIWGLSRWVDCNASKDPARFEPTTFRSWSKHTAIWATVTRLCNMLMSTGFYAKCRDATFCKSKDSLNWTEGHHEMVHPQNYYPKCRPATMPRSRLARFDSYDPPASTPKDARKDI